MDNMFVCNFFLVEGVQDLVLFNPKFEVESWEFLLLKHLLVLHLELQGVDDAVHDPIQTGTGIG